MVVDQIEAIAGALPGGAGFLYGTAKEINLYADNATVWPLVCLYPMTPVSISLTDQGSADNVFTLHLEFLYKTKFENNSRDNEPLIKQALAYCNKFLVDLREYREQPGAARFFKWIPGTIANAMPTYNKHDVNTCGVSVTFKVKLMAGLNLNC